MLLAVYGGTPGGVAWLPSRVVLCGKVVRFAEAIGLKILLLLQPVQNQQLIFSWQALAGFDGQAFPGKDIHDLQRSEMSSIAGLVSFKVHGPGLVRPGPWTRS